MRIDLTVRAPNGTDHDLAVFADEPAPFSAVSAALQHTLGPRIGTDGWFSAGRRLAPSALLGADGLRSGEVLTTVPHSDEVGIAVRVSAGIDAGAQVRAASRIVIGRAADCDLVLTDPDVSRQHLLVTAAPAAITVRDLGSTHGAFVEDGALAGEQAWPAEGVVRIGNTQLALGLPRTTAARTLARHDGTVGVRPRLAAPDARAAPQFEDVSTSERARRGNMQWLATLAPVTAAGALALVLGSVEMLVFALLTPLSVLAARSGERRVRRRPARRRRAEDDDRHFQQRAALRASLRAEREQRQHEAPDAGTVAHIARLPSARLWERDPTQDGRLQVRVGTGSAPSRVHRVNAGRSSPAAVLDGVPVSIDLARGPVGIVAPRLIALAMARWWLCQLVVLTSPARLRIRCSDTGDGWHWLRWLPHLDPSDPLGAPTPSTSSWRVHLLGPGSRAHALGDRETAICLAETTTELALHCMQVIRPANEAGTRLLVEPVDDPPASDPVLADRVSAQWAEQVSRSLAPLIDETVEATAGPPDECSLDALSGPLTAAAVMRRWTTSSGRATVVLGVGRDGPVTLDLDRDGPHLLVGGTTGSGKSQLLQTLVGGLALSHPPEEIAFVLIDYKGGAAFAQCAGLPHVTGVVTDLDEALTRRALESLRAELRRRENVLAEAGVTDLAGYRALPGQETVPRLVIVVDEFAGLAGDLPDFLTGLTAIAQRGRSLGVHLVLATQRPAGVVTPTIRSNCATRIALRMTDAADSRDVVEVPDAAAIPQERPGRAILWRDGRAETVQFARVDRPVRGRRVTGVRVEPLDRWRRPVPGAAVDEGGAPASELDVLVAAVAEAAHERARPRAPWLPALPTLLATSALRGPPGTAAVPIGLVDRPAEQVQRPLLLDLAAGGGLLVVGSPGSGRTTALVSLTLAAATRWSPDELHVHAVDPAGAALEQLTGLPHLATVIGPARRMPGWTELVSDLAVELGVARPVTAAGTNRARQLLIMDGWDEYVRGVDDAGGSTETVLGLVRAGPGLGLTVAVSGDRSALSPRVFGLFATRLVLRLADRGDYALAGLPSRIPVPSAPGRALLVPSGHEVQLAMADPAAGSTDAAALEIAARSAPRRDAAIVLRPLPDLVSSTLLLQQPDELAFAVSAPYGRPVVLPLAVGGRLLVAGPPRSGRSTVLRTLVRQAVRAGFPVTVLAPQRSPLATFAHEFELDVHSPAGDPMALALRPTCGLTVVDDAEAFAGTAIESALLDPVQPGSGTPAPGCWFVVAARSDDLAVSFRGLASEVRRDRCGLLLRPGTVDGDLLGVRIPPAASTDRPGRGVLVGHPDWGADFTRGPLRVQVAQP